MLTWILITWMVAADGAPTLPITFSYHATSKICAAKAVAEKRLKPGVRAACRQMKAT